ncbi:hypothetical protein B0H15DRAFT_803103 [Mycena belliarum]|uniref:RRM domain-containing protein n=1 Tax=Mycena belliarum TaxID=1033014 RepID=A0AAD6XN22_9AGAR|nr:hypothetical protein B0H15DRAFT_803103 [Mycena belliae]
MVLNKTRAQPRGPALENPWVYVGNIHNGIKEYHLKVIFQRIAPVKSVEMRFSGGLHHNSDEKGFRYASVHFADGYASYAALALNGTRVMDADNVKEPCISAVNTWSKHYSSALSMYASAQSRVDLENQLRNYHEDEGPSKAEFDIVETATLSSSPRTMDDTELWNPADEDDDDESYREDEDDESTEGDGSAEEEEYEGPANVVFNKDGVAFRISM